MVRHTLKILQHLLQDYVSEHFTTLRSKGLTYLSDPKGREKTYLRLEI